MMASLATGAALEPAQVLRVDGPDAAAFLHTQLASDVNALAVGMWQWSAWLDAKGRVRFLCQLGRLEKDRLLLVLRGGVAAQVGEALQRYVFRLRVDIEPVVRPCAAGGPLALHRLASDDDGANGFGMGGRSLMLTQTPTPADDVVGDEFTLADIRAGYPALPSTALDTLLPPALGLYRLGAVATNKGCYPGQELVNRLQRGDHKWRLRRVVRDPLWQPGDDIIAADRRTGVVLACAGNEALVVLRDDALATADAPEVLETFAP